MTKPKKIAIAAAALSVLGAAAAPMRWPDLLDRPQPEPTATIAYGADPLQHVDLWLPAGKPPFPTVLMVHGGCWQTDVAKADIMNWIAEDLRSRGIAVWNIEYRGVDRAGGGYSGTFQDVARAADALRPAAVKYGLATDHLVAFGHSAGGHLALWLAARGTITPTSALHAADPLPIETVISVGGLPDLEAARTPPGDTCGREAVDMLVGSPSPARADVYSDTSPAAMMPFAAHQILVNATRDPIAPPAFADAYEARAKAAGVSIERITVPEEGHVELIAPGTAAWHAERAAIETALKPGGRAPAHR